MPKLVIFALLSLFLVGCQLQKNPNISGNVSIPEKVKARMALCSTGLTSKVGASLEAKIGKDISEGGTISADAKRELRGAFFEGADPSDPNVTKSFAVYVSCVENIQL